MDKNLDKIRFMKRKKSAHVVNFADAKKQKKYEDVKFLFKGLKNNLNLKVVNYEDPNKKASRREQFNKILKVPTDV